MMSTGLACDQVGGSAAFSFSIVAVRELGQFALAVDELVDRKHARAAAIGDDADARPIAAEQIAR